MQEGKQLEPDCDTPFDERRQQIRVAAGQSLESSQCTDAP